MKTFAVLFFTLLPLVTGSALASEVVVYTSVDQPFAEPILREFEARTGTRVRAIFDVEATKTTGLVNRLIAERKKPQADVFWNSEVVRTLILKQKGVLAPYSSPSARDIPARFKDADAYWTGFGVRARVLIVNTDLVPRAEWPKGVGELTEPRWRGRATLAYPLFGTTATHVAALFVALGDDGAKRLLQGLKANDIRIVDGNSVTRDRVAYGTSAVGFTDTDDANVAVQADRPVTVIFPDQDGLGTLLMPNTVALVNGSPHPDTARVFIDFLLSPEVEQRLAYGESAQIPVRDDVARPPHVPLLKSVKAMAAEYEAIAERLDDAMRFAQELFVR